MKTTPAPSSQGSPPSEDWSWVFEVIGKPWVSRATGPDAFDCWGLLVWVYKNRLGIELPPYPAICSEDVRRINKEMTEATTRGPWKEIKEPKPYCGVGMSASNVLHHIGLWIPLDGGVVLHATNRGNVVAQSIASLRTSGLTNVKFYEHDRP